MFGFIEGREKLSRRVRAQMICLKMNALVKRLMNMVGLTYVAVSLQTSYCPGKKLKNAASVCQYVTYVL